MTTAVYYTPDGRVVEYQVGDAHSIQVQIEHDELPSIVLKDDDPQMEIFGLGMDNIYVDVASKRLMPIPPRPSEAHEFDFGVKKWVEDKPRRFAEVLVGVRYHRDRLLAQSDWTQLPDAPLTTSQRTAWQQYRQQLRDITDEYPEPTNFDDIQWPTPPSV